MTSSIWDTIIQEHPDQIRLTVIIPTYNEADNLPSIAQALLQLPLPGVQLLVVDDNSPDGTGDVADAVAAEANRHDVGREDWPRMRVLHRRGKGGLGTAYVAGMTTALAEGATHVVQMDADFSHSPAYIRQMLGVMLSTDADVVIGSRYVPGGTLDEGWGIWRRFMSWWANLYSRAILNLRIRDMTAGFKLWKRSALQEIGLERIRSNGYSFQVEMAYLCEKLGFRLIEIPIHFEDRRIGQSKLDVPVKLESAWRTWQIRWRYRDLSAPAASVEPVEPRRDGLSACTMAVPDPCPPESLPSESFPSESLPSESLSSSAATSPRQSPVPDR